MESDKLVIVLGSGRYALDTKAVAGIIETEKLPFLPGRRGFVSGIVSFRNEPVAVIDLKSALGDFTEAPETSHKVIILSVRGRLLGIDIGASEVSFIWDEQLKGAVTGEKGLYTSGRIYAAEGPVDIIDWQAIFNETTRLLTTENHV
jgi:chemotaxis signal transduction protein